MFVKTDNRKEVIRKLHQALTAFTAADVYWPNTEYHFSFIASPERVDFSWTETHFRPFSSNTTSICSGIIQRIINMEDNTDHPPKRRRLDDSAGESSPDELGPDAPLPRASLSTPNEKVYRSSRTFDRSQQDYESESPDELAEDSCIYWERRKSGNRRPSIESSSRSERKSSRAGSVESRFADEGDAGDSDEEKKEEEEREGVDEEGAEEEGDDEPRGRPIDHPMRSPPPPPPPPKPERLYYKEKFRLKGNLRGVSAVQFSPDGSMIATCGTVHCVYPTRRHRNTGRN